MLIEPILGYKSTWRILELFLRTPRVKMNRKELFKFSQLGNAPLTQGLRRLIAANILLEEGKKYYLNRDNIYFTLIEKMWDIERKSLRFLDFDIQVVVSEFARKVLEVGDVEDIILFGSHARGTASIRSDIDLAIIGDVNELEITKIIQDLEKRFKRELQVHYLKKVDKSKLALEIQRDGIGLLR